MENAQILEAEGRINIASRGNEAREYQYLSEKLKTLNNLLAEVSEKYELGELKTLNVKKKELEEKKARLELAQRHLAFLLAREVEKTQKELESLPAEEDLSRIKAKIDEFKQKNREAAQLSVQIKKLDEELADKEKVEQELKLQERARRYKAQILWREKKQKEEELRKIEDITKEINDFYNKYREKIQALRQKEKDLESKKPLAEEYHWIKSAKENYLKLKEAGKKPILRFWPALIISLFAGLAGVVLLLLNKTGLALPFLIVTVLGLIYVVVQFSRSQKGEAGAREFQGIKEQYLQKYKQELRSVADLEAREKSLEKEYYGLEAISNQLEQLKNECRELLSALSMRVPDVLSAVEMEEKIALVDKLLTENKNRIERLRQEIEEVKAHLYSLNVEEKDFEYENPGPEFNQQKYEDLKKKLERLAQREADKSGLIASLGKYNLELNDLSSEVSRWFEQTFAEKIEPERWEDKLQEVKSQRKQLETKINNKMVELRGLGISETDYLTEDPGETYQPEKMRQVEREIEEVSKEMEAKDNKLRDLRTRVATQTGSDPLAPWETLLEALFSQIEKTRDQLKKTEATLISRILLAEVIRTLDREETEKVEKILQSPEVRELLLRLTGRYKEIYPKEEAGQEGIIFVSDGVNEFSLADLSTGAREQVLLALRIAFLKKLLKNQSCFLILDDAFQHTDYDRRPLVVDTLVELAKDSWQVFYLTMDDHIRDLFQRRASSLGSRYHFIELSFAS
jgi:DNA repair exonuclease SbcCD ATPase subunit